MLDSLSAQIYSDWELVLVVGQTQHEHQAAITEVLSYTPKCRMVVRPDTEILAETCNQLLDSLGDWIGFMGQYDWLTPAALSTMITAISVNPAARVIYSDEEARNRFGHISLRFAKGSVDATRLLYQEYLGDLTLIQKSLITDLGGFDRTCSDQPRQDLYLKAIESYGTEIFLNIPDRLYQHRRNHNAKITDPRYKAHMVPYDLQAMKNALIRREQAGKVNQINGTACISFKIKNIDKITIVLLVGEVLATGLATISDLTLRPRYQPSEIKVRYLGSDSATEAAYRGSCATNKLDFEVLTGNLPAGLNQEVTAADSRYVVFLRGSPLSPDWLKQMLAQAQLPNIGAVSARLISPSRILEPGTFGYKYLGWDWNVRGRFNHLSVPHQVSIMSPHCFMIDRDRFLNAGGFNTNYPILFGMDLTLRLDQAGFQNITVPEVEVYVQPQISPPTEVMAMKVDWPGWSDRFGLHSMA